MRKISPQPCQKLLWRLGGHTIHLTVCRPQTRLCCITYPTCKLPAIVHTSRGLYCENDEKKPRSFRCPTHFALFCHVCCLGGRDSVWAEKDHMRGQRRTGDEVELPCDFFAFGSAPMICPIRSSLSLAGFPGMSWLIRSQRLAEATL